MLLRSSSYFLFFLNISVHNELDPFRLIKRGDLLLIYFFYLRGCSGQFARTTTNLTAHWTPCKPNKYVRYRGSDRYSHKSLNPGAAEGDKPLPLPGQDPQCSFAYSLVAHISMREVHLCLYFQKHSTTNTFFFHLLLVKIIFRLGLFFKIFFI
jgi:hypothetical protein